MQTVINQQIAMKLAQAADLLEQQGASPFRVSAYRRASETVSRLALDIRELAESEGNAGLPILHSDRDAWHFTLLYSNTALAHELKRTHDWVIVYFYDDHHQEGQCTVVTETRGPLTGQRVVRGRELECRDFYAAESPLNPAP
jgi:hypothetical protein